MPFFKYFVTLTDANIISPLSSTLIDIYKIDGLKRKIEEKPEDEIYLFRLPKKHARDIVLEIEELLKEKYGE